jgi:hypothetical protein
MMGARFAARSLRKSRPQAYDGYIAPSARSSLHLQKWNCEFQTYPTPQRGPQYSRNQNWRREKWKPIIILLTFANLLMSGFWSFVLVRGAMNLTAALMWGAVGGLIRDMSPRVSRAAALTFSLLHRSKAALQQRGRRLPEHCAPDKGDRNRTLA